MAWIQKTDINPTTGKQYGINPNTGVWDDNYFANVTEKQWLQSPAGMAEQAKRQQEEAATAAQAQLTQQKTDQAALVEKQQGEQQAFLGRYTTGINDARTALSTELGLPALRENAFTAGQTARDVSRSVQDIAPTQQTIAKQVGISAPHLQQRIGAETAKMQPSLETARRALEDTNAAQQFGETQYTNRLQEFTKPYQMEAEMLSEALGREFSGFTQQMQNELNVTLQKLSQGFQLTQAELDRANQLALNERQFEQQKQLLSMQPKASAQSQMIDLGDRTVLVDAAGNIINSYTQGLAPSRGGGGSGNSNPAGI